MPRRLATAVIACAVVAPLAHAHHDAPQSIFTVGAAFKGPAGVEVGPDGTVFVAETIAQRVRAAGRSQSFRTIAGNGRQGNTGDGGRATAASLQDPSALAVTPRGVAVADTANDRVRLIRGDGTIAALAGTGEQGFSGDGGPAAGAQLNGPAGLEAAGDVLFVADTGNHRVRMVDAGGAIRTIAGNGSPGFAGDGGPAAAAQLNRPTGLALAPDGALLVADSGNRRIRRIGQNGVITTYAGNGGGGSSGDGGPATAAGLNDPVDVAASAAGDVFIAEAGGNRVRRVAPDGTISRFAGAGGPRFGGDGGSPASALLNSPRAVEIGPAGTDLLIADSDNDRLRYVVLPTPTGASGELLALATRARSVTARLRGGRVTNVPIRWVVSQNVRATIEVRRDNGRRAARFTRRGHAGANAFVLPRRLREGRRRLVKGFYVVTFAVRAGARRAVARTVLVVR